MAKTISEWILNKHSSPRAELSLEVTWDDVRQARRDHRRLFIPLACFIIVAAVLIGVISKADKPVSQTVIPVPMVRKNYLKAKTAEGFPSLCQSLVRLEGVSVLRLSEQLWRICGLEAEKPVLSRKP